MSRVLLISHSPIQRVMAGPAIRCWEIAKVLALEHEVTLVSPAKIALEMMSQTRAKLVSLTERPMREIAQGQEILLAQGFFLEQYPFLRKQIPYLIVDLYDPFTLESLERFQGLESEAHWHRHLYNVFTFIRQCLLGDFFICASQKQKDFYLGWFSAINRINPLTYRQGEMDELLAVVPFGISAEKPVQTRSALRYPGNPFGFEQKDVIFIWGGGLWPWLDPWTPMQALEVAQKSDPRVKLFFMGASPTQEQDTPLKAMRQWAEERGLLGRQILFNPEWVDYAERFHYLNDADVGISSHGNHLETRFSFRTRILDYLWTGLPIISTLGDSMAQWISAYGLGYTPGYQNVEDWVQAILSLTNEEERRERQNRVQEFAKNLSWDKCVAPLLNYCASPYAAADNKRTIAAHLLLAWQHQSGFQKLYYKWLKLRKWGEFLG